MTRGAKTAFRGGLLVILSLLTARETAAQAFGVVRLGTWGGSIESGYQSERQNTHSPDGGTDIDFARRGHSERLIIRNEGFSVLDPRLFTGNLGLTFGLVKDRDSTNGTVTSHHADLTGYAFDAVLLAEKPYSGTLFANRAQNFLTQQFGRTDTSLENRGATFRLGEASHLRDWGIPYLSANLRAEQQGTKETTTSVLGQSFRRDELRNILDFNAHKGFETADLDLRYEFNDLNNLALPQLSFQSQTANLNYSLDFGPALNRRSDTRLSYSNRSGVSPITTFTADQQLRIEHLSNLSTNYRYLLTHIDTQAGTTASQSGLFQVRHQLYQNLTTNAQLSGLHAQLPTGVRDTYAGQVDFSYRRSLPWNGTVFARTGGRIQLDDNRLQVSQLSVIDESHGAPSPLGAGNGFLLDQPFVVASAIVVLDTRGGARLATAPGIDYDIVSEGNLTRIVPLPTSAVIQAGDPLAVSYAYEVDPSIKYGTTSGSLGGGVDFRWIAFSFGHEQSDQTLISGRDTRFLQNVRRDTAQLDLRGTWKELQGQAGAAYVRYDSTRLAYTQQRYTQFASYRPLRSLALSFNADWTLTDFTLPVRQTDARSMRLTLDWYAPGGWTTTALVSQRVFKDSELPTETVNEASLKARLNYGKLNVVSGITATNRTRGGFELTSWLLNILTTRRF